MPTCQEATRTLEQLGAGDVSAAERLLPIVYEELRALASGYFRMQSPDHTLQPTALVHEAFARLIRAENAPWQNRAHFMAVAATAMRQILTDHARRAAAEKRGANWAQISLDKAIAPDIHGELDLVALAEVLDKLLKLDSRKHRVVELRFFGGLTVQESAEVLGVSIATVEADWRFARAWMGVELSRA